MQKEKRKRENRKKKKNVWGEDKFTVGSDREK